MVWVLLFLVWSGLAVYTVRNNFNAVRLCRESYARSDSVHADWLPFLRTDRDELPGRLVLFLRSIFIGPFFFALACLSLATVAILSTIVSEHQLRVAVALLSRFLCFCGGLRVKEVGVRATPAEAPCVVSNHVSACDPVVLIRYQFSFVGMEAAKRLPAIGTVTKAMGCIFVARDNKDSRTATKEAIAKRLKEQYTCSPKDRLPQLAVFPEGTTTNGKYLLQYRRGAFEAHVPIQPVWIEYSDHVVNYTIYSLPELLCLACSLPARDVCLHWLPVIKPSSPEQMADEAREAVIKCKSAFGFGKLIKQDTTSHREGIAVSTFFRSINH